MKTFIFYIFLTIELFASNTYISTEDDKNAYLESTHFRVIVGKSYKTYYETFAQDILDAAEHSWEIEINQLIYKKPKNSDTKKIDIYIGNSEAYNYEIMSYAMIDSNYAGQAMESISDDSPYIVINSNLKNQWFYPNLYKVVMAHEFFHAIQFNYDEISDSSWNENSNKWIWWFEATATLIEDEVYDDINDYTNYIDDFFDNSFISMETYNGWHEYSMVIFAKYLKEKFGIDLIKKSFEYIEGGKGYFEIIDEILKSDYSSSIKEALKEFGIWVANPTLYFEEGSLYPDIKKYGLSDKKTIEKGGILLLKDLENYPIESKEGYSQTNEMGIENILATASDTIIVSNFSTQNITPEMISENYSQIVKYALKEGWQLVAGEDINSTILEDSSCLEIVWGYKNGEWKYFSNNIKLSNYNSLSILKEGEGYWFKSLGNCIIK